MTSIDGILPGVVRGDVPPAPAFVDRAGAAVGEPHEPLILVCRDQAEPGSFDSFASQPTNLPGRRAMLVQAVHHVPSADPHAGFEVTGATADWWAVRHQRWAWRLSPADAHAVTAMVAGRSKLVSSTAPVLVRRCSSTETSAVSSRITPVDRGVVDGAGVFM
jgi:hypothetical protein